MKWLIALGLEVEEGLNRTLLESEETVSRGPIVFQRLLVGVRTTQLTSKQGSKVVERTQNLKERDACASYWLVNDL